MVQNKFLNYVLILDCKSGESLLHRLYGDSFLVDYIKVFWFLNLKSTQSQVLGEKFYNLSPSQFICFFKKGKVQLLHTFISTS